MNLKRTIKSAIFQFLWMFLKHNNIGNKPICIFSSRRGGSTWLQEIICSDNRIRFIDQPFSFYSGPPFLHEHIPIFSNSLPLFINNEDKLKIEQYLNKIFDGSLVHSSQWRFWQRNFWLESNRILLKITKGKPLIDWLSNHFNIDTLYLIRHPISQSISVMKTGWENDSWVYLKNDDFKSEFLNKELFKTCVNVLYNGSKIEKYVLNWCLENLIPFKSLNNHKEWTLLSYEECVTYPNDTVDYLAKELNLVNVEAMKNQIEKPSRTAKFTNSSFINVTKKEKIYYWKNEISNHNLRKCFDLIEQFQIDYYTRYDPFPTKNYLRIY
jgi:hypothetical protein